MSTPSPGKIFRSASRLALLLCLNFTVLDVLFVMGSAPVQRGSVAYVAAQLLSALVLCLLVRLRFIVL